MLVDLITPMEGLRRVNKGQYLMLKSGGDSGLDGQWYHSSSEWPEHRGSNPFNPRNSKQYEWLSSPGYFLDKGSCDYPEQLISIYGEPLESSAYKLIVIFELITKTKRPDYRWEHNGSYVGTKLQDYEVLGLEPFINHVYHFRVLRKKELCLSRQSEPFNSSDD
jgi:hypothetical protein